VGIGLVAVVALIVVAAFAVDRYVRSLDFDAYRDVVEGGLSDAFGREVRIAGDLQLRVFPRLEIQVTDVTVASEPGRVAEHLLRVGELNAHLELLPLWQGRIVSDRAVIVDAELHLEPDEQGQLPIEPEEGVFKHEASSEPFAIRATDVELRDVRVFHISPETGELTSLKLERVVWQERHPGGPVDVEVSGELDGGRFDVAGRLGSFPELLDKTRPLPLALRGRVFEADVELEGSAKRPFLFSGLDLAFSVTLPDLKLLETGRGRELPDTGPVRFTGRLVDPNDVLAVRDLEVVPLAKAPLRGSVSGGIGDLLGFREVELKLELETDELRVLQAFIEQPIPEATSASARGTLHDRDGTLGIEGTLHAELPDAAASIDVRGASGDVARLGDLDVRFEARARDLATAAQLAGREPLPDLGQVQASGRLRDRGGDFRLDEFTAELNGEDGFRAKLEGRVGRLRGLADLQLRAEIDALGPAVLSRVLDRPLPDLGPVRGFALLHDRDGPLALETFELSGGREGLFSIDVSGKLKDVRALDEISVQLELEARDLTVLGALAGLVLPEVGPVEFSGRADGTNERLGSSGRFRIGRTVANGSLTGSIVSGERPRLEAELRSPHLYLEDVFMLPKRQPESGARQRDPDVDQALPLDRLRLLDARAVLHAERVTGRGGFEGRQGHVELRLEDGDLSVHKLGLLYEGGRIEGELRVDARTPEPELALDLRAENVILDQLPGVTGSGVLDALIDVRTRGSTRAELADSLFGSLAFTVGDWTAGSEYVRAVVLDLSLSFLPGIGSSDPPQFGCLAADFEIERGVATAQTLVLSGARATIDGAGRVYLAEDGRLDLRLTPTIHQPGLISTAATVDVRGTLAKPRFRPVARRLATSAVRSVVTNSLRPQRLLRRPLELGAGMGVAQCPDLFGGPAADAPE
jgi:hypothetical protein